MEMNGTYKFNGSNERLLATQHLEVEHIDSTARHIKSTFTKRNEFSIVWKLILFLINKLELNTYYHVH